MDAKRSTHFLAGVHGVGLPDGIEDGVGVGTNVVGHTRA